MQDKCRFLKYPAFLECFVNLGSTNTGSTGQSVNTTTTSTPVTGQGECPAVDPLDHTVLLPNPEDCSSYFSCSNGVPILMHCPDGLYFNDELDVCDWPRNVSCIPGKYGCVDSALCSLDQLSCITEYSLNLSCFLWIRRNRNMCIE